MIGRGMFDNVTEYKGPDNNNPSDMGGGSTDGGQVVPSAPPSRPVTIAPTAPAATTGAPSAQPYQRPIVNIGSSGGSSGQNVSTYKPPPFKPANIQTAQTTQAPANINTLNSQQTVEQVGGLRPATTQIGQNSLVQNQMNNLLNQDNAYMRDAALQGKQQAAAAGLMNSSMGIGAMEQARIRAALPIAQQDASLYGQANLQDSAYNQQGGLSEQAFGQNAALSDQAFGQNQSLAEQQFGHNQNLQNSQFEQNQHLANQQGQINQQAAAAQAGYNMQQQAANNQFQAGQNQMQTLSAMEQNLQTQIANIEQNPDTPPNIKQQQIQALQQSHQQSVQQLNVWTQQVAGYKQSTQPAMSRINSSFQFKG